MNPDHVLSWMHKTFPNADKLVNELMNQDEAEYPGWCLLPIAGWQAIVAEEYRVSNLSGLQIKKSAYLAALEGWRFTHGIYSFSPDFYKKLLQAWGNNVIDEDNFYALPEWTIYMETPELLWNKKALDGVWANLVWDNEKEEASLNLVINSMNRLKLFSLPLVSLYKIGINYQNNSNLYLILLLIQYICLHYKDFYSEQNLGQYPQKPQPKLYKGKRCIYPIPQAIVWKPFFNEVLST